MKEYKSNLVLGREVSSSESLFCALHVAIICCSGRAVSGGRAISSHFDNVDSETVLFYPSLMLELICLIVTEGDSHYCGRHELLLQQEDATWN